MLFTILFIALTFLFGKNIETQQRINYAIPRSLLEFYEVQKN